MRCRISYREQGSEEIREDVWLYQFHGTAWEFAKVVETGKQSLTDTE